MLADKVLTVTDFNGFLAAVALGALLGGATSCAQQVPEHQDSQGEGQMAGRTIEEVLSQHTDSLMSIPGVVGTAIGECAGKPCIKVLVVKKTPELSAKLPTTLDGFVVDVQETGEIKALDST